MSTIADKYLEQINTLFVFNQEIEKKTLERENDSFFVDNINFFVKSMLITLCIYFESYIKECIYLHIDYYNNLLNRDNIPNNLVLWSIYSRQAIKENRLSFSNFVLDINKNEIEHGVSAAPKTFKELFKLLGINLDSNQDYSQMEDRIQSIAGKRNQIIHYNDNASDITLHDIASFVSQIKEMITIIDKYFDPLVPSKT